MNKGKYVFSQLMDLVPDRDFRRITQKYSGNKRVRVFSCSHLLAGLFYGHLSMRESLRDIVDSLSAHQGSLYHLGLGKSVHLNTFSRALRTRSPLIYKDFALLILRQARLLESIRSEARRESKGPVYALDGSIIKLCLSLFPWADYQNFIGAVRLHLLLDTHTKIPRAAEVTSNRVHETKVLAKMKIEPGATYVMDRGYMKYSELYRIDQNRGWFVVRAQANIKVNRLHSRKLTDRTVIKYDRKVRFRGQKGQRDYPKALRMLKLHAEEYEKPMLLLTNIFEASPEAIGQLYSDRWEVELFFKWIKQHLRIKSFWGRTENAVQTQIWACLACYGLLSIVKNHFQSDLSLHKIRQILSVSLLSKVPLRQLFTECDSQIQERPDPNQLRFSGF